MHPAGAMFDKHQDIQSPEEHGVHVQEIDCDDPGGMGVQELPPARARRSAGSMPAAYRIFHTVDGAIVTPRFLSSPWMRRSPHSGFSFARRAMPGTVGGRPALRRLLLSYFFARPAASLASRGKTSAQRLRGISRASAANQARSAGSYRTRLTGRRSTAFSWRSTSSSASFARVCAELRDGHADHTPRVQLFAIQDHPDALQHHFT